MSEQKMVNKLHIDLCKMIRLYGKWYKCAYKIMISNYHLNQERLQKVVECTHFMPRVTLQHHCCNRNKSHHTLITHLRPWVKNDWEDKNNFAVAVSQFSLCFSAFQSVVCGCGLISSYQKNSTDDTVRVSGSGREDFQSTLTMVGSAALNVGPIILLVTSNQSQSTIYCPYLFFCPYAMYKFSYLKLV